MNVVDIDSRIKSIMIKMEKLKEKSPKYSCGVFPPQWDPPLSSKIVEDYEVKNKIKLPTDYKRFITTIAAGGTQPFYGLYSISQALREHEISPSISEKFLYTARKPLDIFALSEEEYKLLFEDETVNIDAGFIPLCTEGDGMYSILIVNTDDEETYATVWYYDIANDAGIYPMINPKNQQTMCFLDWLEYYVDKTYELADDDYFGYAELAGKLE